MVVHLLLRQLSIGDGKVHADIKLRNGNFHSKICKCLQVSLDGGRDFPHDQMALDTNAVDRDTVLLELFDKVQHCRRFSTQAFDIVIVDVEFGSGVRGTGGPKREWDVGRSDGVVKYGLTGGSIVVERFFGTLRLQYRCDKIGVPLTTSQLS